MSANWDGEYNEPSQGAKLPYDWAYEAADKNMSF